MNNIQLSKLVDNLKNKIKKLEYSKYPKYTNKNEILTWRIHVPANNNSDKKYVGLLFSDDFSENNLNLQSFIKLTKSNYIINYSITLKVDKQDKIYNFDDNCSFSLGIRDSNNKIKIIKGSKTQYKISSDCVGGNIIVNNTVLYEAIDNQELCLIGNMSNKCSLISKKSIIKLM